MEALLAGLRASQYRCAVDSQHAGSRAETAEERSLRLQEQVLLQLWDWSSWFNKIWGRVGVRA